MRHFHLLIDTYSVAFPFSELYYNNSLSFNSLQNPFFFDDFKIGSDKT
jgi:hypothetical protein